MRRKLDKAVQSKVCPTILPCRAHGRGSGYLAGDCGIQAKVAPCYLACAFRSVLPQSTQQGKNRRVVASSRNMPLAVAFRQMSPFLTEPVRL